MITVGSISREEAQETFEFLAEHVEARSTLIKEFIHTQPDHVFWIHPNGNFIETVDAHRKNYPKGYKHILDKPGYGGFMRCRVASKNNKQLIVVSCHQDDLADDSDSMTQFLTGILDFPIPIDEDSALVISDNGDMYGTVMDISLRLQG